MYILKPFISIKKIEDNIYKSTNDIIIELANKMKDKDVLCVETYPGVDDNLLESLKEIGFDTIIETINIFKEEQLMTEQMKYNLTDDRVRGRMYFGEAIDFMDKDRLVEAKKTAESGNGKILVYGFGASLVSKGDCTVYADVSRWEIQTRYRNGGSNYNASNFTEDILRKFKRSYFIEWRIADKIKVNLFDNIDYYIDANDSSNYKMVSGRDYFGGLSEVVRQPFRTVPYFDRGVWGGQWMKEKFSLNPLNVNYAWSFDGVPEENSLILNFNGTLFETPALNLVLYLPQDLLGDKVYQSYGAEFPIRFDYLDTMGGQNLSFQVHPDTELIRKEFGMAYSQSESYYIMQAKPGSVVYLGLKEDADIPAMFKDLRKAQDGEIYFDTDKYVNMIPVLKHDHFLIPPGTVHCSGEDTVVLEISSTPYIFTFKLWDWGRIDLDGKPRPVHVDLGEKAIYTKYRTKFVQDNLVNKFETLYSKNRVKIEKTGLYKTQPIETLRYSFDEKIELDNNGKFSMLNIVEGDKCIISSPDNAFEPYEVHYGETIIIPANICCFSVESDSPTMLIRAFCR